MSTVRGLGASGTAFVAVAGSGEAALAFDLFLLLLLLEVGHAGVLSAGVSVGAGEASALGRWLAS